MTHCPQRRRHRLRRGLVFGRTALAGLVALTAGCSDHLGQGWDWNRMRVQPRYEPYGAGPLFADGKAMQAPPAGTVPREATGAASLVDSAGVVTPATLERGASRFHIYCAVCHGERGDGLSIVASNMEPPRPPSLLVPPVSVLPGHTLVAIMTSGFGRMPSYAAELTITDRWAVAAYVALLQRAATDTAARAHERSAWESPP